MKNIKEDNELNYLKHQKRIKNRHYEILIDNKPIKILNHFIKDLKIDLISKYKFDHVFDRVSFIKIGDEIINVKLRGICCNVSNYRAIFDIIK